MTLLAPLGLAALALAVPVLILHMLTPRRPAAEVSSLQHWDGLHESITAADPWQRIRWSLLLLLQLLVVALLAFALARPALVSEAVLADHTVFIVDASGSMAAIDGRPDRLAEAVERATDLRDEIPDVGVASVVVASASPQVLVAESDDAAAFRRALASIRTSPTDADWEATFALAESLVSPDRATGFVLVSDGALDEVEQRLAPLGMRFESVGSGDVNRAITDLSVTAGPGGLVARVTIESTGGPDATQLLRLDVDDATVDRREVTVPSGGVIEETFELPLGSEVAAFLDGEDLLASDNQRYAAAPVPGALKVRVVGEATFFVDQLLASIPSVDRDVAPGEPVDLEVYVGVPVPAEPEAPFIAIDAPGGIAGLVVVGRSEDPIPTLVSRDPVLEDIDVSRMAIAEAQVVEITDGEVLLGAPGVPLVVRTDAPGVPAFYVTFTLEQSNLPVDVAFPILGSRMVGELTSADGTASSIVVGDAIPVTGEATITDPRGDVVQVGPGEVFRADLSGVWSVVGGDGAERRVAANPAVSESDLTPVEDLPAVRVGAETTTTGVATVERSLLPWAVGALLVVLAVEWAVGRRSRGVGRRQWNVATAVRVALVVFVIAALVDPTIDLGEESVTAVFVVDASDSLGSAKDEAAAWVNAAITAAGEGDQWAVVEVGADARVATPVANLPYVPASEVDPSATALGRGLRLAESLFDGETRQRIVVVSDGRTNTGDLGAEIERLVSLGAVVDVHTVSGDTAADAAVAGVDAPSSVGEGETYTVEVEVVSSVAVDAAVELRSGDAIVGLRTIALTEGTTTVPFDVVADEAGLQSLTASVRAPGDAVERNDESETAVEVRGPASVLVVEGDIGEGLVLHAALVARGLVAETVPAGALPGLQDLSRHRAVILVDVEAEQLTEGQTETLDTFVRDLGRGLLVVGGEDSFALGGYRDTDLEALLPVQSEADDAKREATVAEVLLIDTSESMGACHCGENDEFIENGVNKTDISKAAAARAAAVLGANDEIGVLAFSGAQRWMVDLQTLPADDVLSDGIAGLEPFGETRIIPALAEAAEALRSSDRELKHIILFTDGFTPELAIDGFTDPSFMNEFGSLVEAARDLADEGITVSVVGTGEGATAALEEVAIAGNGRFYPGRDLDEIPEIFVREARLAARSFINEGEFFPTVTSTAAAVRDLASSPALLGFVATTPKPTADVHLRIGEYADPLLASWRVGLGRVTAWTSDGGDRWAARWASWDGFGDFWSNVVRDTFPLAGAEGQVLDASITEGVMQITLESAEPLPAGTAPIARVGFPDGTSQEVRLDRISDSEFGATVAARQGGTYAVGTSVDVGADTAVLSAIASRSFATEYLPGEADPALLVSISVQTGGRGEIAPAQAFERDDLAEGSRPVGLRWWLMAAAALLWPIDVALRRLRFDRRARQRPRGDQRPSTPMTPAAVGTH